MPAATGTMAIVLSAFRLIVVATIHAPAPATNPMSAAARNVACRPTAGKSTNPAASAPAIAPSVLKAYTRAVSQPTVSTPADAVASASGNAAPSANVIGRSRRTTRNACWRTIGPKAAAGSATCAAMTSGRRDAANQAAPVAAAAVTTSVAASHTPGCGER